MVDVRVLQGDCVELMRAMPECSVDAIVTDPPYELGFMGKQWDGSGIAYSVTLWGEALRVLKPGGHLLAFGGTRTYHRMACAIEDAGFEIRDSIHWVYGSGFPKSLNVSKAIDKAAGAEREVLGEGAAACEWTRRGEACPGHGDAGKRQSTATVHAAATAPATDEAKRWDGWGTALKPAHEPIVVARKPLSGTVAANVLEYGTGALNIDGCRVAHQSEADRASATPQGRVTSNRAAGAAPDVDCGGRVEVERPDTSGGRWPANIVLDAAAAEALDQQSGVSKSPAPYIQQSKVVGIYGAEKHHDRASTHHGDLGGASRFFTQADFGPDDWPFVYQAKPSKRERNAGLDGLQPKRESDRVSDDGVGGDNPRNRSNAPKVNHHPTVKPVALMRHLVRLVTPPDGTVLDPFAGSGTTLVAAVLEGFNAIGCEMTDEYLPIIQGRVEWARQETERRAKETAPTLFDET